MATSKETRVRVDGRSKIIASTRPAQRFAGLARPLGQAARAAFMARGCGDHRLQIGAC